MRRLIRADEPHERRRATVARDELGVGQHLFSPGERVESRDLDEQQADHPPNHHLEREIEIRETAHRFRAAPSLFRCRRFSIGGGEGPPPAPPHPPLSPGPPPPHAFASPPPQLACSPP